MWRKDGYELDGDHHFDSHGDDADRGRFLYTRVRARQHWRGVDADRDGVCYSGTESLNETIILFCVELALGIGAGYASIKYFPKTATGKKMILAVAQTGGGAQPKQAGDWIGREGVAQTPLRPAGAALIDGQRLDVVAESGMIESGSRIKIMAVNENRLVVRKLRVIKETESWM